jgi:ferrochelatase
MYQFSHALWKSILLSGLQKLQIRVLLSKLLFPLYPQHAMASTTIVVLADELRKKNFPEMKLPLFLHFTTNQITYKNLADSIKDTLRI